MNTLSWLIYAAAALDKAMVFIAIGVAVCAVAIVTAWFFRGFAAIDVHEIDFPNEHQPEGSSSYTTWQFWKRKTEAKRTYAVPIALLFLAVFLPSSTTVYMIAASEAGEAVVTSEDGQAMLNDLREIIRQKLEDAVGGDIRKDEEA